MNKLWFLLSITIGIMIILSSCEVGIMETACEDPDSMKLKVLCIFNEEHDGTTERAPCRILNADTMINT